MEEATQQSAGNEAAVSVTVNGALINPTDQKSQILIRGQLNESSVAAIAVAEYEKICKREIEYLQGLLGDGQLASKNLEEELKEQLQELVDQTIEGDVEEARVFYKKHGLAFRHEAVWARDGLKLKYTLKFFSSVDTSYHSSSQRNAIESTPSTLTLTQSDIKEMLRELRDQTTVNTKLTNKLQIAKSRLQDLPAFKRTAEARIAKEILGNTPEYAELSAAMTRIAREEFGVSEAPGTTVATTVATTAIAESKPRKKSKKSVE